MLSVFYGKLEGGGVLEDISGPLGWTSKHVNRPLVVGSGKPYHMTLLGFWKLYLDRREEMEQGYLKSLYLELKALGQCGCEQWKGFSPVWLVACRRSFSCEVNSTPHTKHSFPLALSTSSPSPSPSLPFSRPLSRSLSLSARGGGAELPNTLAAVRRPSSSGVSVVIQCEASAAVAAMAALECRCHENSRVATLLCRLNAGYGRWAGLVKNDAHSKRRRSTGNIEVGQNLQ